MRDAKIKMWCWEFQDCWEFTERNPQSGHSTGSLLSVLFDNEDLVYHEHAPLGETMTKEYFTEFYTGCEEKMDAAT